MKLQNPIDVNITDKTVSVLLAGGLGNMMFQTATLMVYAKEMGYDPIVGYWTTHQSESSKFNSTRRLGSQINLKNSQCTRESIQY